jgi:hypothetical protein
MGLTDLSEFPRLSTVCCDERKRMERRFSEPIASEERALHHRDFFSSLRQHSPTTGYECYSFSHSLIYCTVKLTFFLSFVVHKISGGPRVQVLVIALSSIALCAIPVYCKDEKCVTKTTGRTLSRFGASVYL